MPNASLCAAATLVGRLLLAAIFILEGWAKINNYGGSVAYAAKFGIPAILMPGAIAVELVGGLLIAVGFQTRLVALALAGFCIVTAAIFHSNFADHAQAIQFWKNVAIAGGFLVLAAHGAGAWSLDQRAQT